MAVDIQNAGREIERQESSGLSHVQIPAAFMTLFLKDLKLKVYSVNACFLKTMKVLLLLLTMQKAMMPISCGITGSMMSVPQIVFSGSKIMYLYLDQLKIRVIDSFNFFPIRLAALP